MQRKVFYPLTFPITAGPGVLVVTLTLSAHASKGAMSHIVLAQLGVVAGMLLNCAGAFLAYAFAPRITARISPSTVHGILRVIAFVLLCIGAQIAWNGLSSLIEGLSHVLQCPRRHGIEEEYIASHEQFRGLVLFNRTQAAFQLALERHSPEEAIDAVRDGVERLTNHQRHVLGGARHGRLSQSPPGRSAPHLRTGYPQEVLGGKDLARAARRSHHPGGLRAGSPARDQILAKSKARR